MAPEYELQLKFKDVQRCRDRFFSIHRTVTLGKTNVQGGAYFAEYFAWCGEAREEMLATLGHPNRITFHTSAASMKFLRELAPFDQFEIVVSPRVAGYKIFVRFFFVCNNELMAVGDQELCLMTEGRIIAVPANIQRHFEQLNRV